ncbi:hypothetical protein RHO14_04680 [Orbus wheelerorum]|uniref:hypothetical protein n=1 Tax=Orbus wheelerorum TaxID=3074111 RepID=UPI00370DAAF7
MDNNFLEDNDLDWFATFNKSELSHFTSGGSIAVPEKIKESIENYEMLYDYFLNLKQKSHIEIMEENLPHFLNQDKKEQYLRSYIDIASKGLFSYDINLTDNRYFLVAKPHSPLLFADIPEHIQKLVCQLSGDIESVFEVK